MNDRQLCLIASCGLVVGALFGMAGAVVASTSLRGILWGIDGTALIIAAALLTIHHARRGNDMVAAGFLVFVAGESLIVVGVPMDLRASVPFFGAGSGLWAASLILVSLPSVMPFWMRITGIIGALLFAVVAAQIYTGQMLNPLSEPLPFYAYPFLALTLFGWAWVHYKKTP